MCYTARHLTDMLCTVRPGNVRWNILQRSTLKNLSSGYRKIILLFEESPTSHYKVDAQISFFGKSIKDQTIYSGTAAVEIDFKICKRSSFYGYLVLKHT